MKKFLLKFAIFTALFFLLDFSFVVFKYHDDNLFAKISREKMDLAYENYFSANRGIDMLIMGSSHAQFAVDPKILNSKLGQKAYNLAYGGGTNLGEQVLLLEGCVKRKLPIKRVLFFIEVFSLDKEVEKTASEFTRKFVVENSDYLLSMKSLTRVIPLLSKTYKYGRNIRRYLKDLRNGDWRLPFFKGRNKYNLQVFSQYYGYEITEFGFVKGYGILNKNFVIHKGYEFEPKEICISLLEEFVSICKTHGIEIIFVQIPEHEVFKVNPNRYAKFNSWMTRFCLKNGIVYIDINNIREFPLNRDEYFFDSDHLNYDGAQIFTRLLGEELLKHFN